MTCEWRLIHQVPIKPNKATVLHQYRLGCDPTITHWRPKAWQFCPACGRPLSLNNTPETSDEQQSDVAR